RESLTRLENRMAESDFWNHQEKAQEVLTEAKLLRGWVEPYEKLTERLTSASEMDSLLQDTADDEMSAELDRDIESIQADIETFELKSLLRGRDDFRFAQLEISAGAGGTEAQDWAQMLMRMYTRWAERRGFDIEILDESQGEEAGIKGAVLEIRGEYAFGFLRAETGVHRLVRISPFDSAARRHTSFASVFVYPVVNEEINIEINEEDLRIDVYRASGAGGQHVNKTSSAVRITHIPSGLVVASQQERSQFKNKSTAMKMLKNKLYQAEVNKLNAIKDALNATKADVSFGSQIRSYVFQPYTMVNDHRTELKIPDVQKIMDGGIDPFIEAYLKQVAENSSAAA
ncbi:MAG: peptide chain release factor 2, partial [Gemmatimonadaceae bacterium]|nr:peptide chain release factor 2 [Gemmatimonadaceae bacterium]